MKAVFVELPAFARYRSDYLDDDAFLALQNLLMKQPEAGDPIQDTGGLRKLRFADIRRGKGKRGGLRVIYYWWVTGLQFWLFTLYDKDEIVRPDCTAAQGTQVNDQSGTGSEEKYMKTIVKSKSKRAAKRDLFGELSEGVAALADARQGKRTLRTHALEYKPAPEVTPKELIRVRESLNLSRALFAVYLRTNVRTLENWEQGRARPNAQAALLINLVKQYPDTVQRLAAI